MASYWTKRRKILKNLENHLVEINEENEQIHISCTTNVKDNNIAFPSSSHASDVYQNEHSNSLQIDTSFLSDPHSDKEENDLSDLTNDDIDLQCNVPYYLTLSDSEDTCETEPSDNDIKGELTTWALEFDIPQNALSRLLCILRPKINDLPKDPRTLLNTKIHYEIESICGGQYFHFGIKKGILNILSAESSGNNENLQETVKLQFNMDGLPLFRSSSAQFWPILARTENFIQNSPFIVGLFYGNSKPSNVNDYLKTFTTELADLKVNGIEFMQHLLKIEVSSIICDAPARAFIKNTKQFSGYHGCDKCTQTGVWNRKMTYPDLNAQLRSDSDFDLMLDEDHHKGPSPLIGLVGMVSQFPLDYMHLVCLGVVKRLILIWLKGPLTIRIGASLSNQISEDLFNLRHFIPSEFARRPRGFSHIDRWKATEYRQFLLYTGPIVLKNHIHETMYHNFMILSVSMHILLNSFLAVQYNDYCRMLLKSFVEHFSQLYGSDNIVYNVHGLVHLADDAKKYGSLDNISSFPFENFLMSVKKMVRKPSFPLQQIIRRLSERKLTVNDNTQTPMVDNEHDHGPVPDEFQGCSQYKCVKLEKFKLSLRERDQYFRLDNDVCQLENILMKNDSVYVVYRKYRSLQEFFDIPLNSQLLGIYSVSNLSGNTFVDTIDKVQSKYIVIPYRNQIVAMPFTDNVWDPKKYNFCVVEFQDNAEVAVIPKNWLRGSNHCVWPPYKSSARLEKAIKNMEEADEDTFSLYKLARIMYKCDLYSKAYSKLKDAELQSDIQTEDEELNVANEGKRIRRPTVRYESDSSPEKSPMKRKHGSPVRKSTPKKARRSLADLPHLPPPPTPPAASPVVAGSSRTCLQEMSSVVLSPRQVSAVDKRVLTVLEEVKLQVMQNTKLLQLLIKRSDLRDQEMSLTTGQLPDDIVLPISSMDHFNDIERKLESEAKQKQLVAYLGTIGGETVKCCTRRILLHTLSHEVSLKFSWKGSVDKKAFCTAKLSLVVKGAVRKNRLTATATDREVEGSIQNWLRTAKDREGGRKERMKKKAENAAVTDTPARPVEVEHSRDSDQE